MQRILKKKGPQVMGILNITPDSFSDGGRYNHQDAAVIQAEKMATDGVDIIDIGGESTRPGAEEVSLQQELNRVIPIIEKVKLIGKPISIDTSKAEVMAEALKAGASMINDVRALREEGALKIAAESGAEICLMHMQGQPRSMQLAPKYSNIILEISNFLAKRIRVCIKAGVNKDLICVDPGFGFGKTLQNNCALMRSLAELKCLDVPILMGVSRKKMIGDILNAEADKRLVGSVSAAMIGLAKGAKIVRVHDVKETVQAVNIFKALN